MSKFIVSGNLFGRAFHDNTTQIEYDAVTGNAQRGHRVLFHEQNREVGFNGQSAHELKDLRHYQWGETE